MFFDVNMRYEDVYTLQLFLYTPPPQFQIVRNNPAPTARPVT